MANLQFKKVSSEVTYIKANGLKTGALAIDGLTFVETKESTKFKGSFGHWFKDEDGSITCLNGSTALNRKMESVKTGDLVQVIYTGKFPIDKGPMAGKEAHGWDVLVAVDEAV